MGYMNLYIQKYETYDFRIDIPVLKILSNALGNSGATHADGQTGEHDLPIICLINSFHTYVLE
jgi:hypothetical protein